MKKTKEILCCSLALIATIMLFTSCIQRVTPPFAHVNPTVTDTDGNVYHTVVIGTQTWMVENLNTTHYRNGEPIGSCEDWSWGLQTSGAYCDYNDDPNNSLIYGKLYNGYAVMDPRNIAPAGWHVATETDWNKLSIFLGGSTIAGDKLKEVGSTHWVTSPNSPANAGTNSSGFTAIPGGYRDNYALAQGLHPTTYIGFNNLGDFGLWWTSTPGAPNSPHYETAFLRSMFSSNSNLSGNEYLQSYGLSVRCIHD